MTDWKSMLFTSFLIIAGLTAGGLLYWVAPYAVGVYETVRYGGRPDVTYRFRLVVEVEVEGMIKRGSSVIDVKSKDSGRGWGRGIAGMLRTEYAGDAVLVDLGGGRNVVALLLAFVRPDYVVNAPAAAVLGAFGHPLAGESRAKFKGSAVVRGMPMPVLIGFRDVNDPSTATILNPFDNSFTRHFGQSVRFHEMRVEMVEPGKYPHNFITGEPIVPKPGTIVATFPWLGGRYGTYPHRINELKDALRTNDGLGSSVANGINDSSFYTIGSFGQ